ncbi:hypothetical protein NHQ30_000524 [Ciborinia camelliae]|nr:hypothetical protein NHQ30_000524 [Ciborinia camelliae]
MHLHTSLLVPVLALLTNAQFISFPSIDIEVPSIPDPKSFAVPAYTANGHLSSTSFSSSSSSFADGQGGTSLSQISTTCNADSKCETQVNGIVNGTVVGESRIVTSTVKRARTSTSSSTSASAIGSGSASGSGSGQQPSETPEPVVNGGLLGGNANLAASGTAGSTVVVTGSPTVTAKAERASSEAGRRLDGTDRIIMLALGIVMGDFML